MLKQGGFTMVEAVVAIALVGIGVSSTVAALTQMNNFASVSRNATGAYAVVMNQIDKIQSDTPFNPQKGEVPAELTLGTSATPNVSIYKDSATNTIVSGTMTTTVTDDSTSWNGVSITRYRATVAVTYRYLNRNYSFTMNTIRASDE